MTTLALDLAAGLDPVILARRAYAMECDPWQRDALRSDAQREAWCCSRQVGKTSSAAVLALAEAGYRPGSLTLAVSPSQRQSDELGAKVAQGARVLGVLADSSKQELRFTNGSRVISLPSSEQTIRGYTANLLILDEAAAIPDATFHSVTPMVAVTGGRVRVCSTPRGRRGWFYDVWMGGDWLLRSVTASECPRLSAEFLEEQRRQMGPAWYRQEYECSFVESEGQVYPDDYIDRAGLREVEEWDEL